MPLDELVGAPPVGDPRIDPEPFHVRAAPADRRPARPAG
jgi:hypothetical protein